MCHQLNHLFNGHSLGAFLLVETFKKMNSRGMVDNSCKPGVSACRHRNWRELDISTGDKIFKDTKKNGTFFLASWKVKTLSL